MKSGPGRDPLKVFGATVRELRRARGLTQKQLGARAETHGNYIGLIERGERNPSTLNICYLAFALDVLPAEFFRDIRRDDLNHLPGKSEKRLKR